MMVVDRHELAVICASDTPPPATRHRQRADRQAILDGFCVATGYNRKNTGAVVRACRVRKSSLRRYMRGPGLRRANRGQKPLVSGHEVVSGHEARTGWQAVDGSDELPVPLHAPVAEHDTISCGR
jgi:hypothetical protein